MPQIHVDLYQLRFSVNLSFGALDGVGGTVSSSMADMGGEVARGDGTAAGKPNDEPRLNPRAATAPGVGAADPEGPGVAGKVPLLNSAHLGHLRLVFICPI